MSNKKLKLVFMLSLVFIFLGNLNLISVPVEEEKKSLNEFLDFLNSRKDELKYKNVGVLEHNDRVEVRIHCDEETLEKIMSESSNFGYTKVSVVRTEDQTVTVVVIFSKTSEASQDPAPVDDSQVTPPEKPVADTMPAEQVEPKPKKCPKKVKVQIMDITPQTFLEYKYYRKPIAPAKESQVNSVMNEPITEVLVNEGDNVVKDQILLKYDSEKIMKDLKVAEGQLAQWKKELFRREHWKVRSSAAEEQAKRHLASAEESITQITQLLNQAETKSPSNGNISFIASKDAIVPPGEALLKVIDPSVMKIQLQVEDIDLFEDAQRIILSFKDSGMAYVGRVEKKENSLSIIIENDTLKLTEGMVASFRALLAKHENAIAISPRLLQEDEKGKFIYIVNEKFAKKAYLSLGPIEEEKVLVRSGLSLQDKIISTGIECLEEGKKIKIIVPKTEEKAKPKKEEHIKPVKKEETTSDKGMLKLSLGLTYHMLSDDIFKNVYGSSLMGGYLELGYGVTSSIEAFLAASILSKKGTFTEFPDEVTLSMYPAYLGAKFKFKMQSKIKPYIGAALAIYNLKEKTDTIDTPYQKGTGFAILGGTTMNLSAKLGLFLDLKYDLVKISIENATDDLDLSGLKLSLGLTYKFKLF